MANSGNLQLNVGSEPHKQSGISQALEDV